MTEFVGITGPELCKFTGENFQRFETRRRRAREQGTSKTQSSGYAFGLIIDDEYTLEKWTRYNFRELLSYAKVLDLQRGGGVSFEVGARIVAECIGAFFAWSEEAEFWICADYWRSPTYHTLLPSYFGDSLTEIVEIRKAYLRRNPDDLLINTIQTNVSATANLLLTRLTDEGFRVQGEIIFRKQL